MNHTLGSLPNEQISCSPEQLDDWAQKLRVCGHPMRLKILCLIEKESSCVTDLWRCLDASQPVVSQHLAALKEKNIVGCVVEGNRRLYHIEDSMVRSMVQDFLKHSQSC